MATIKLNKAMVRGFSGLAKNNVVVLKWRVFSGFDQISAAALGIKEEVYDANGALRGKTVAREFDLSFFRPTIKLVPGQRNLFNDADGLKISPIVIDGITLRRTKDEGELRLKLTISTVGDESQQMFNFMQAVKNAQISLDITPAAGKKNDDAREEAKQLGLLRIKDEDSDPEEEDEDEESDEEADEDEDEEEEKPAAKGRKRAPAVASAREMRIAEEQAAIDKRLSQKHAERTN